MRLDITGENKRTLFLDKKELVCRGCDGKKSKDYAGTPESWYFCELEDEIYCYSCVLGYNKDICRMIGKRTHTHYRVDEVVFK